MPKKVDRTKEYTSDGIDRYIYAKRWWDHDLWYHDVDGFGDKWFNGWRYVRECDLPDNLLTPLEFELARASTERAVRMHGTVEQLKLVALRAV